MMRIASPLVASVLAGVSAAAVQGHEFWIDPLPEVVRRGDEVAADLRVGQMMAGEPFPWLGRSIDRAWQDDGVVLEGREGDLPALTARFDSPGLHGLAVVTRPAYVTFDSLGAFREYLDYEGNGEIADAHMARGLKTDSISEEYLRNARALLQIGADAEGGDDAATGLEYELVVAGNPFVRDLDRIDLQLLWLGVPEEGRQVAMFHRPQDGPVSRTLASTNSEGRVGFRLGDAGDYLFNAVHVEPVDGPGAVRWRSHWASLFFTRAY